MRRATRAFAAAGLATLALPLAIEARDAEFPSLGCWSASRFDPCRSRVATPIGDPTEGPLTDDLRNGPLDPPDDPLGVEANPFRSPGLLLTPTKDRLGVKPKDHLGTGR
ncbi:MAG: hypothetical protein IT336_07190 [Thermomicrobiales bacterium]|nr:hypothetical protein [Thermomicrobiales bacterium]